MTAIHLAIAAEGALAHENRPCLPAVWTAESAREFASTLAPREFAVLVEALKSYTDVQQAILLLAEIRAGLGQELPQVAAVYFEAFDYDGWFYLKESATVYYRDGRPPGDCDFSITVNEIMTSLYGPVGETTGLLIVPGLGEFEALGDQRQRRAWAVAGRTRPGTRQLTAPAGSRLALPPFCEVRAAGGRPAALWHLLRQRHKEASPVFTIIALSTAGALILGGLAGYLIGTRRIAILKTALTVATRSTSIDRLTGLPNRDSLTIRLRDLSLPFNPSVWV